MSGPIVRRYGFPNFEKIFGERPIEHGADEPEGGEQPANEKGSTPTAGSKAQPDAGKTSGPAKGAKGTTS
ncbi:MAG: hypothetical protein ACYC61_07205 [Isosphaeraceae bacterium]